MAALRRNLPSRWELITAERRYSVSAEPLRVLLLDAEREKKPETRAAKATEAADWAFDIANQANAYAGAQTHSAPSARPALERILSRREFCHLHGPTRGELFLPPFNRW